MSDTTVDEIWALFREVAEQSKETDRKLKEYVQQSQKTERIVQELAEKSQRDIMVLPIVKTEITRK